MDIGANFAPPVTDQAHVELYDARHPLLGICITIRPGKPTVPREYQVDVRNRILVINEDRMWGEDGHIEKRWVSR